MLRIDDKTIMDVSDKVYVPEIFIGYKFLTRLLESKEARCAFLQTLHKKEVIAELIKKEDGVYVTSVVHDTEILDDFDLEGVGFCEEV